jgi:dolichol-phosphate mannosyltransferase
VNAALLELFVRAPFVADVARSVGLGDRLGMAFMGQPGGWAAALAVEGSIINNFLWNNFWTFGSRRAAEARGFLKKFASFNMFSLGSIVIQFLSMGLSIHIFGNTVTVRQVTLVLTIGALIVPLNWLIYTKLIWKLRRHETA